MQEATHPVSHPLSCPLPRLDMALIALLALFAFVMQYPGQASVDTIIQLENGLSGVYNSNQPPAMSFIIAHLTMPGTLLLDVLLFAFAVAELLRLAPSHAKRRRLALFLLFLFPVSLIYIGILWKDVLFANAAILGMLLLPPRGDRPRWRYLVLSAAVLALGTAVRQQGILVVVAALLYLLFASGLGRWRWRVVGIWLVAFVVFSGGIKLAVNASGDTSKSYAFIGPLYQLAMFDLGGIASRNPDMPFPALTKAAPTQPPEQRATHARIEAVMHDYQPRSQDAMGPAISKTGVFLPPPAVFADWRRSVLAYPGSYLLHRFDYFTWVIGCHDVTKCLPFYFGISAQPAVMVAKVGIKPGMNARAHVLNELGKSTLFLFRPILYLALSLALTIFLIYRDWRRHSLMIAIQLVGLAYAASYLLVGIACDFRYTYLSTLASLFGVAYVLVGGFGAPALSRRDRPDSPS